MKAIILLTTLVLTAHAQSGVFNVHDLNVSGNSGGGGNVVMGGNLAQGGGSIGVEGCSSGNCGTRPSWGCSTCYSANHRNSYPDALASTSSSSYPSGYPNNYPGLYPRPSPKLVYPSSPNLHSGSSPSILPYPSYPTSAAVAYSGSGLNSILPGLDVHGSGINLPVYGALYA